MMKKNLNKSLYYMLIFNLNLTEKSFLEIWNKYQQGEYNDLLEEDEEDFENDLDWGD